jgi:hypothetical protein
MSLRKVEWLKSTSPLSEIYQDVAMKFSLANEIDGRIKQCHPWVKCRDFIHDVIRGSLTKSTVSIYGLKYVPSKHPEVSVEKSMMLITMDGIEPIGFRKKLNSAMMMINRYENLVGQNLSKLSKVAGSNTYKHVWLFSGPKMWIAQPHMISLLTLLFRLPIEFGKEKYSNRSNEEIFNSIVKNNEGLKDTNNLKYIKAIKSRVENVVKHINMFPVDEKGMSTAYKDANINLGSFHNRLGIVSVCSMCSGSEKINEVVNEINKEK